MQWAKVCVPLGSTRIGFKNNSWICKIQPILGSTENECCREHLSSNPFCTTVCLITELIYLLHYLISSSSHSPDENSDYCPSMGQGGELNFHCLELGERGIVQKTQRDWKTWGSRVMLFFSINWPWGVFSTSSFSLLISFSITCGWVLMLPLASVNLLETKIPYISFIAWTALDDAFWFLFTG